MEYEKILPGIDNDDVVTFDNRVVHKTFCVSQFREIINTAFNRMEDAYADSLKTQGHHLPSGTKFNGNTGYASYDEWFDAGVSCKILRLADPKWTQGKMRIRVAVEFIPDNEEDAEQTNESALDELRNSIELS